MFAVMNISMFRMVRKVDQTPTKEVIKEFLRFIGCIVSDHPVPSAREAETIMADTKDVVDILLGFECADAEEKLVWEKKCPGPGRALIVRRGVPSGLTKREYYAELIDALIDTVWADPYGASAGKTQREQLRVIRRIFFDCHLFGCLLSKRSLRIIDMPEIYGSRFRFGELRQKLLAGNGSEEAEKTYIPRMLDAFFDAYNALDLISAPGVYARYARINAARKIWEVRDSVVVEKDYEIPSAEDLLKQLNDLYDLDRTYMGTIFLAAAVCKSEPTLYLTSSNYLRLLLDTIQGREGELYSFVYYEYGRHLERVYRDWEHAVAYYQRATRLWKYNYQARFKLGCYEAQYNRDYPAALQIFQDLRAMIAQVYSGDESVNYENLTLTTIQYLFKTDIWIWILSSELDRNITAGISLKLAEQDVSNYKKNACASQVYAEDDEVLKDLQAYHEDSLPVRLLEATVGMASAREPVEDYGVWEASGSMG